MAFGSRAKARPCAKIAKGKPQKLPLFAQKSSSRRAKRKREDPAPRNPPGGRHSRAARPGSFVHGFLASYPVYF